MAYAAVDGAIQRAPSDGGRAALAIVDAVDPMLDSTLTLRVNSPSDVEGLSFAELALAVRQLTPSSGSTSHVEAAEGAKQHADLEA